MDITVHRTPTDLKGKQLSAHTITSFMVMQGVQDGEAISAGKPMPRDALLFLNRSTAINYWVKNGWLLREGDTLTLLDVGAMKVSD